MYKRIFLINLALWALCAYATLQLVHCHLVDVLGPVSPPPAWMDRYAGELASRGLNAQAVQAYEEILRGTLVGAERRSRIHFQIAQLYERVPGREADALANYLRVLYLSGDAGLRDRAQEKVLALTRARAARSGKALIAAPSAGIVAGAIGGGAGGGAGGSGVQGAATSAATLGAKAAPPASPGPMRAVPDHRP